MISHIDKFSKHLFWDIDKSTLDFEQHAVYIIKNVLNYGFYSDWKLISDYYGNAKIIEIATKIKDLDVKTMSFLSAKGNVKKEDFLCYTSRVSTPKHWNF